MTLTGAKARKRPKATGVETGRPAQRKRKGGPTLPEA